MDFDVLVATINVSLTGETNPEHFGPEIFIFELLCFVKKVAPNQRFNLAPFCGFVMDSHEDVARK